VHKIKHACLNMISSSSYFSETKITNHDDWCLKAHEIKGSTTKTYNGTASGLCGISPQGWRREKEHQEALQGAAGHDAQLLVQVPVSRARQQRRRRAALALGLLLLLQAATRTKHNGMDPFSLVSSFQPVCKCLFQPWQKDGSKCTSCWILGFTG